jgi:hypothetical protein
VRREEKVTSEWNGFTIGPLTSKATVGNIHSSLKRLFRLRLLLAIIFLMAEERGAL